MYIYMGVCEWVLYYDYKIIYIIIIRLGWEKLILDWVSTIDQVRYI